MAEISVDFNTFARGEGSPRLKGRTDYAGYYAMLETEENMVSLPQGGATRRPGTLFAALAKDQTDTPFAVRVKRFQFSVVQAYMLVYTALAVRVFMNRAPVLNLSTVTGAADNGGGLIRLAVASTVGLYTGNTMTVAGVLGTVEANGTWIVTVIDGTHVDLQASAFVHAYVSGGTTSVPVEIPTVYTATDLAYLNFCQSNDTLYTFGGMCPGNSGAGYPIYTLTRSSHTNWTFAKLILMDGPYLSNVAPALTTLTPSGTSGSVTLTASNATGINNGAGFKATDVGRLVRIQQTNWAWLLITAVADTTHVTATVQAAVNNGAGGALDSTSASTLFALGKWSDTTGYPYCGSFFQNRFSPEATNNQPNAMELSVTADFTNMSPTQKDNSVQANNALGWVISDDQVNPIRWVSPAGSAAAMQFGIGTGGGECVLQPATTTQGLSGTNVQVYRETEYGTGPAGAPANSNWPAVSNPGTLRIGKALLFANMPGRKIHEWQWSWQVNGYLGPDLTVDAEHITRSSPPSLPGVIQFAYQQHPYGVVWATRGDGQLIALTYLPEQSVKAWHRHPLGGQYYGGPAIVESLDCMPSQDGSFTELWLAVLRTIAGVPTRTIEVMMPYFDGQPAEQGFFMDCGALSALTTPAATLAMSAGTGTGVTFTASAGTPFASGDVNKLLRVNQGLAIVRSFTNNTHVVGDWYTPPKMTKPATAGNWSLTAQGTTISGMTWLNGETVQLLGDGADMQTAVVSAGAVTLPSAQTASLVAAGLPQTYNVVTMPFSPKAATSVAGRVKRIDHLYIRLLETLEQFSYGQRRTDPMTGAIDDKLDTYDTRFASNVLGQAPPLISSIQRLPMPGGFDLEAQIKITGSGPFPLTLLAIGAKAEVAELQEPGAAA